MIFQMKASSTVMSDKSYAFSWKNIPLPPSQRCHLRGKYKKGKRQGKKYIIKEEKRSKIKSKQKESGNTTKHFHGE